MAKVYTSPIQTRVFFWQGVIMVVIGVIGAFSMAVSKFDLSSILWALLGSLGLATVLFGLAQTVDFLGRIAHDIEDVADTLTSSVLPHQALIAKRFTSGPLLVQIATPETRRRPSPITQKQTPPDKVYHYFADGSENGPFSVQDMKDFLEAGVVQDETLVFKDGDTEWGPFRIRPELQ